MQNKQSEKIIFCTKAKSAAFGFGFCSKVLVKDTISSFIFFLSSNQCFLGKSLHTKRNPNLGIMFYLYEKSQHRTETSEAKTLDIVIQ